MPIYEYVCGDCGHPFEELVRRGHEDEVRCPACESDAVKRRISLFGPTGSCAAPPSSPFR